MIDRYKGNIKGFLEEDRRNWMVEADYDEAKDTIRIVDKGPSCSCPMVKVEVTPPSFCDCTLGWQVEAYTEILGRPVTAELEESILRGGKKCIYRIKVIYGNLQAGYSLAAIANADCGAHECNIRYFGMERRPRGITNLLAPAPQRAGIAFFPFHALLTLGVIQQGDPPGASDRRCVRYGASR